MQEHIGSLYERRVMEMPRLIVIVFFLLSSVAGCSGRHPTVQPPLRSADVYPNAQTIAGLTVAVDEISDPDRARSYFGADLTKDDILPVNIIFSNRSDDRFLVRPADVLMTEGNSVIDPVPAGTVEKLTGDKSSQVSNLAMQKIVLPPLANYQGVIFFKVKKTDSGLYGKVEKMLTNRLNVRIVVTDQDSGERILFGPYPLSGY